MDEVTKRRIEDKLRDAIDDSMSKRIDAYEQEAREQAGKARRLAEVIDAAMGDDEGAVMWCQWLHQMADSLEGIQ